MNMLQNEFFFSDAKRNSTNWQSWLNSSGLMQSCELLRHMISMGNTRQIHYIMRLEQWILQLQTETSQRLEILVHWRIKQGLTGFITSPSHTFMHQWFQVCHQFFDCKDAIYCLRKNISFTSSMHLIYIYRLQYHLFCINYILNCPT